MYFPRAGDVAESTEDPGGVPVSMTAAETVLVVEDDKDLRAYLIEVLRDLDYRAIAAQDAVAALGILEQREIRVDLLLTDVVLPGMNGRELAQRAGQLRPGLKVLFMSGYSRNAVVHQGRVDRGVHLVQKPISLNDLAARIRDVLDQPMP
jgi:CheY-like chemotaxis protein